MVGSMEADCRGGQLRFAHPRSECRLGTLSQSDGEGTLISYARHVGLEFLPKLEQIPANQHMKFPTP
jgi:hypothetical protein